MSNLTGDGIADVKKVACETLLDYRSKQNTDALVGGNQSIKREEEFLRGTYIAYPKKKELNVPRLPSIP